MSPSRPRGLTPPSAVLAGLVCGQAVLLLTAGLATFWWSEDLMIWLIHRVGEDRALGAGNVVRQPGGGLLLTNPGAMVRWTLPIWAWGVVQIGAAGTLLGLWADRRRSRR